MRFKKVLFNLCIIILAVFISYWVYFLSPISRESALSKEILIDKGIGFSGVADFLEKEKFIRSAFAFKVYSLVSGSAHLVKPGYYNLSGDEGAVSILEKLIRGPEDITIKIIEGATLGDIDLQLFATNVTPLGAIKNFPISVLKNAYPFLKKVKSLEGFLFPDTYKFALHSDAELVIRKMLDNFSFKGGSAFGGKAQIDYDKLIIASLIEKEAPDNQRDRELISGIIARRLRIGMGLQIDATVIYAKCRGILITCQNSKLTRDDFSIASLYNTYTHRGLPPTPIGNPGLESIVAAKNPLKSDYLYYLTDPRTGKTIFNKTFEEHDTQRAKYINY